MTEKELKKIEAELERRGYRKFKHNLTSNETYGWFKSIGKNEDEDGYLMEVRVWKYDVPRSYPTEQHIGLDFYSTVLGLTTYSEFEVGWEPICDTDTFERMAAAFNTLTRRFVPK